MLADKIKKFKQAKAFLAKEINYISTEKSMKYIEESYMME